MNHRRMLQLIRDNQAATPRALTVKAEGDEATVYLYDIIDAWWGVSAKDFAQALAAIEAPVIHLRINSPGGDVFEARAMAQAVREHKSKIITHVDGLAASAATYLAIAAKEVEMADGAFFMIHQAWAIGIGNADEMRHLAGTLDKVDEAIVADYVRKTGKAKDELVAAMAAETWYSAEEAKAMGFVDRVAGQAADDKKAQWNLSAYAKAPAALLEARKPAPKEPEPTYDRAALERRFRMYEAGNRIAA